MQVTGHAIKRYKERTGCKDGKNAIKLKIKKMIPKSVLYDKKFNIERWFNNGMTETKYYVYHQFTFVVVNNCVVTILV